MNAQILVVLIISLVFMTFIPYYAYLRKINRFTMVLVRTWSFAKIWFTFNTFGLLMLAFFFGLIGFGIYAVLIFFIGLAVLVLVVFLISESSMTKLKRAWWPITICLVVLLIVISIYYISCVKNWSIVTMDMTPTFPLMEFMFVFIIASVINSFPLFDLYDVRNKRIMQYFMLSVLAIAIILFALFEGYLITRAALDPFSQILFSSMQSPIIGTAVAIIIFGTLVKTLSYALLNTAAIGNILISWVPTLIWAMIFMGVIPVPSDLTTLFSGFQFFGWFIYLMIVAIVFILMIAISSFFTNLTERVNIG